MKNAKRQSGLYLDIQTVQLWKGSSMLTADLSIEQAEEGLANGTYFLMSGQAVGFSYMLNH